MKITAKGRFGNRRPAAAAWAAAIFFALGCREGLPAGGSPATPPPTAGPAGTFDGSVRYDLAQDAGGRSLQGLTELADRYGVKPYGLLESAPGAGAWQTERVVFRDLDSGATIVRLTNDPWANQLSYFRGNWSADGQYVVFRRCPGMWESLTATHGPMTVRSDGRQLRNAFRDYPMVRQLVCSPTDPRVCYGMTNDKTLVAFDLQSGKIRQILHATPGYWHLKISLDGKYLMSRADLDRGGKGLWIASSDGREYHEISIPEPIHDSYQFHPTQKKIMFWYEGRFPAEGFVQCDFDGANMTKVPTHFDWNHGDVGPDRGVHAAGYITRIEGDTWLPTEPLFAKPGVEYYDNPASCNGYLAWMPKDRPWVYASRIAKLPYLSEIQSYPVEPAAEGVVNRYRICFTGMKYAVALDHLDASPDGTKVLYNSNMFGRLDVYYVVARLPESPRDLSAQAETGGMRLRWKPPKHHAEIAGYHVYRSSHSGYGYVPITDRPLEIAEYSDRLAVRPGQAVFYAVTAVEHSGLESGLSQEACAGKPDGRNRTVTVEAQQGQYNAKVWIAFDASAAGLHYIWMRARDGEGRGSVNLDLPATDQPYWVWARVKGEVGVEFQLSQGDRSVALDAPRSPEWSWKRFAGRLALAAGKSQAALASRRYGSALDSLVLTTDPDFDPARSARIRWPQQPVVEGVSAAAGSPYTARLSWNRVLEPTFKHYNLYCGRKADFAVNQGTLVASPDSPVYWDWELKPGETVYYRVTWVDRGGNESPPSLAAKVALPPLERYVQEFSPAARIEFRVPRDGAYVVWLKIKKSPEGGSYINLKIDEGDVTWSCGFDGISDEAWFTYDQWGRCALTAGVHHLAIDNRTKHAIEKVLVTNDFSFRPEGHVTVLSGW